MVLVHLCRLGPLLYIGSHFIKLASLQPLHNPSSPQTCLSPASTLGLQGTSMCRRLTGIKLLLSMLRSWTLLFFSLSLSVPLRLLWWSLHTLKTLDSAGTHNHQPPAVRSLQILLSWRCFLSTPHTMHTWQRGNLGCGSSADCLPPTL